MLKIQLLSTNRQSIILGRTLSSTTTSEQSSIMILLLKKITDTSLAHDINLILTHIINIINILIAKPTKRISKANIGKSIWLIYAHSIFAIYTNPCYNSVIECLYKKYPGGKFFCKIRLTQMHVYNPAKREIIIPKALQK